MPEPRVVIYARISEDRSGARAGVSRQIEDCEQLAKRLGAHVVAIIEENDTSAYGRKPRPGWNRLVGMAQRKEIDGILTWHTDRLYRHPIDLEQILAVLEGHALVIHTVTSGDFDLNTSSGRMVARMLGAAARSEVERTADRISRAHRQIAEEGRWKGGRKPWGYEKDGVTIKEDEAQAIRAAAQMVLNDGTLGAACDLFPALTGRSISRTSLREVLIQPRIAGYRQHWPTSERDQFYKNRRENETQVRMGIPWSEITFVPAVWPAILDDKTWRDVRAVLLDPKRRGGQKRPRRSMLAGLLRCGECAQQTEIDPATDLPKPVISNLGFGAKSYSCARCGRVAIDIKAVERLILAKVGERLQKLPTYLPPVRGLEPADQTPSWMSLREELEEKRGNLVQLHIDGVLALAPLQSGVEEIERRLAAITQQEDDAHRRAMELRRAQTLAAGWAEATDLEKGAVIAVLADYFVVERVARSGRNFQPGRVSALWHDEPTQLKRLGDPPIPPETTEAATAARKLASETAEEIAKAQIAANRKRRRTKRG